MRRTLIVTAILTVFAPVASAQDEPTAAEIVKNFKAGDLTTQTYVGGMLAGLKWANAKQRADGKDRLYCAPDGLAITSQQGVDILSRFVVKSGGYDRSAGMVMMLALGDIFPCSQRTR